MKILVTGATGFVGSVMVNRLLDDRRFAVTAAVRSDGANMPPGARPEIIGHIDANTVWQPALAGVQTVIHLAARVHVMRDAAVEPLTEFRRTNVAGTLNLARQAAAARVQRFIFISSIKVNGEGTLAGRPYTADDAPAPLDPYGLSKFEAENELRRVADDTGMQFVIVRPPLVYGPCVKGNFLRLLSWIERGLPLPFANVDNRRSLLNVRNLVDLVVRCIEHPAAAGKTFLLSDGEDLSTSYLVRRLAATLRKKPRLFPVPLVLGHSIMRTLGREDLWQRVFGSLQVDCTKTMALLGWNPPVRMEEGLEEVGGWYLKMRAGL